MTRADLAVAKIISISKAEAPAVIPPATALPRLWRMRTLAQYWSCSKPMIHKLVKSGQLEAVRIGNQIRITEASALAYIRRKP